jgi:serine/threonine protein kinase
MDDLLNGCYRKYRKIGEGSGGKVYIAEEVAGGWPNENSNLGNTVNLPPESGVKNSRRYLAMKKMKLGKGKSPEQISEFQLMTQLNHPNLVRLEASFVQDKSYCRNFYLVM